jgi:leader peptidase (prepilin peptidase)/N-methyltransferase
VIDGVFESPIAAALPFFAIFGLILGSFVGALSYRLPRGASVARGRSACTTCGATLRARDLIPVLSWAASRGACRYCGSRISWRYPAIELTTAALFVGAAFAIDDLTRLALVVAMTPIMVALAVIDFEHHRLPNVLIAPLALLALAYRFVTDRDFGSAVIAAAVVFALAVLLDQGGRRLFRQGLGMGDAKLMAVVALALPILPL